MGKSVDELAVDWMKDPEFAAAYAALKAQQAEYVRTMIRARQKAGLSQAALAKLMNTTQSAIARLESGAQKPSLNTVERYATACKMKLRFTLVPLVAAPVTKKKKAA